MRGNVKRLLLIEDERTLCELLRIGLLEDFVECAGTLKEGLEKARLGGWDAIVLDLGLECGPDYTITKIPELTRSPTGGIVPVIVLSGWSTAELVKAASGAGAVGYVCKEDFGKYGADYLRLHLNSALRAGSTRKTINELQRSLEVEAAQFRKLRNEANATTLGH